jgi:hypothetical protein
MTDSTLVHDLLDLPAQVHEGDFVLKLTEGLQRPEETAGNYVVTAALAESTARRCGPARRAQQGNVPAE